MKKLLAILLSLLMLASTLPVAVFAEMGGDFPWTGSSDKMLIEEILERDGFIDGIWMPWFNAGETGHNLTGNDLMADYYNSNSSKNWDRVELDYHGADKIYREIYNLKAMGYNILAYGGSIFGEGVIFGENGDVLGIKEEYLNNARRLLNMCREIGMPVMWNIYFHDSSMPSYYGMEGWHVICQMLGNPTIADHYAERFVRPLCEMLAEYPDVVALVSIADEPENQINDLGKGDHFDTKGREMYGVNQDDMIYFMQQINEVAREELPGVARTVASNNGNKTIYRDFDLDLMGHNQYTDGDTFKSVESLLTDADPILTEYNVGNRINDDTAYANKLITFREWMMANGYKGGFQWCWTPGQYSGAYALQRTSAGTAFRKTVALLRYYMDEYRAEYRGETITVDAPVLYANAGDGKVLFIPSKRATKITVQRSDDGGVTWKNLVTNANQSTYVNSTYLIGTYTDSTTRPTSGYCYRIIATDANGNSVTSQPNDLAGTDKTFKKTYTAPTYTKGKYYITSSMTQSQAKLTSFGVEKNRPLSDAVNLIQNGSFESTGGQWNNSSFLQYAQVVDDSTTPDGSKSLYFDTSAQSNEGWYTFTVTGLKANTEYTFSSFIKGAYLSDSNKGQASIGVIDPDTGKYMFYWEYFRSYPRASRETKQMYPTAYDDEWHIRSVTFNTGELTTATIALYGYSSQIWVDGLALFETTNGMKYENGESSKAIVSTEYSPASGATNAVADPAVNNASYWNTGAGYKQGFMSIASGKLTYTASSDPKGVRYTKWIDVKPGTDYYVSYTVNVTTAGAGRVSILDNSMLLPHEVVTTAFSSTGTKTVTGRISTGKYDQLGLCVVDLGGAATIDNVYLYEGDASIVLPTTPSYDGYVINGDFEIGSSNNWENLWSNNTVEMVAGRDSAFAMKGTANSQYSQVRQKITVEPNTDYILEVWAKNVSNTTLILKDSSDANLKQTGLQGSGSTWTKTTMEFNSGSNEFVYLGFMGNAAGSTWTVDDVTIYKKPTASFDGYLSNGDFEVGEQDWTFGSGSHAIVNDAHGGNNALQLTNPGKWGSAAEQTFAVEPNTSYTITWWYKATPGTGLYNLYTMNASGYANLTSEGGANYMNNYTGAWQQGTYVVNSGSATAMILKWSTEGSNPGTILIDDIVVAKTEDVECTHTYTSAVTKTPTCGATGVRTYTCSLCGDSYTEVIAATGAHAYDNSCDTSCNVCGTTRTVSHVYSGSCDQYCNVCGAKKTGLSIGNPHTYDNDCDADCNVCGETRTVAGHAYDNDCDPTCNNCGAVRDAAHSYKAVVTAPDCVNGGYTTYTCTVCGDSYKDNYTEATDHNYVGVETKAPTCGETGVMTYTCSACGDSYTEEIAATGAHEYACDCKVDCLNCRYEREPIDYPYYTECFPSAEGPGLHEVNNICELCGSYQWIGRAECEYTDGAPCEWRVCTGCGDGLAPTQEHDYIVEEGKATCENFGYIAYTCSTCGYYYNDILPALGHPDRHFVEGFDATCTALGELDHWYCPDCDCYWIDDSFDVAYDETIIVIPMKDHVVPDSCTGICTGCGEYIAYMADHNLARAEAVEPTCTTPGNILYWYCVDCGMCWDEECNEDPNDAVDPDSVILPALGHSYKAEVTAPDCVNGGYTTHTCTVCGDSYKDAYTEALGHTYAHDYDVDCDVCGAIREVSLPITFGGNSVSEDVSGLAFRFDVAVEGMTVNGTTAVYEGATVNGYKLISMGAIVSNGVSEADIPAVYLCDLTDTSASYAVRVIKIPASKYDVEITAIPYFVVEIDGVETTIYGEIQTGTYNGVLG